MPWEEAEDNADDSEDVNPNLADVVSDDGGGGGTNDEKLTDSFVVCPYDCPNGGRGGGSMVLVATIGADVFVVIDNGKGNVGNLVVNELVGWNLLNPFDTKEGLDAFALLAAFKSYVIKDV